MVTSRSAFGFHGNKIPAVLSYLALVGWETVGAVLSAFAAKTVARRLDPDVDATVVMTIAFNAVIVVSTVVGVISFPATGHFRPG